MDETNKSQDQKQKFYGEWIAAIASRTARNEIVRHLQSHAAELTDPTQNEPIEWSASMQNLLDIYKRVYDVEPNVNDQLARLQLKHVKSPEKATPPPHARQTTDV